MVFCVKNVCRKEISAKKHEVEILVLTMKKRTFKG